MFREKYCNKECVLVLKQQLLSKLTVYPRGYIRPRPKMIANTLRSLSHIAYVLSAANARIGYFVGHSVLNIEQVDIRTSKSEIG